LSDIEIVRAHDHKVMRWKNGGGETAEVAVWPRGAGLDAFDWRLSMAKVQTDGPFSAFPGVDRTLAILEGEGMRLSVNAEPAVTLTKTSAPLTFAADAQASARLIDGPVLDLNMMSRRRRVAHSVTLLSGRTFAKLAFSELTTLIFCAEGAAEIDTGAAAVRLAPYDTLVWKGGPRLAKLEAPEMALIYVFKLQSA
jgi:uncharacterized protein